MEVLLIIITFVVLLPYIWSYMITLIGTFRNNNNCKKSINKDFYITTIICAHNEEKSINNILDCINNQTYKKSNTYVVLDNCTDNTEKVVSRYRNINIIKKDISTNKGDALNYGIEYLKMNNLLNDVVLILDADSTIDDDLLEKINYKYKENVNAVMVCNKVLNPYDSIISSWYAIYWSMVSKLSRYPHDRLNLSSNLCGCGMSFKKEYVMKTKTITEDVEYFFLLGKNNIKVDYINNAYVYQEQPIKLKDMCNQLYRWTSGIIATNKLYKKDYLKSLIDKFSIIKLDVFMTSEVCTAGGNYVLYTILLFLIGIFINNMFIIYSLILVIFFIISMTITACISLKNSNYKTSKMLISIFTYFIFIASLGVIYNYSRIKPQKKWIHIDRKQKE